MPFAPLLQRSTFPLLDVAEPQLYREQFPYSEVPRTIFDGIDVPLAPAEDIWITDTTFRDGQQARPPYTPEQIVQIFDLLHKLSGPNGVVRQSEFFIYSQRDRKAVEACQERGYRFPEVTSWIRAVASDLELVKSFGIKETGILTSVSDYHIFLKLKKSRAKALEDYLGIVKATLDEGIIPRCHFEDITRADIYGFCLPFAEGLLNLSQEYGLPVKVRLCDTMGYGLTYPRVALPRSIPRMVHAFVKELGYPSELLEWHGHNDFHKVHTNAVTAWLYGVSALNASLLGYGERTGNPPLEGAILEYISLLGTPNGVDTRVITEIADYFRNDVKAVIPQNYPFVGSEFNTTRAGIHADGLLKNPEIYNIFDTEAILNRPLKITVTDKSGVAGIAAWINENVPQITGQGIEPVSKRHPGIKLIYNWIMEQYEQGRTTSISPEELEAQTRHYLPSLFVSDFEKVREQAVHKAVYLAEKINASDEVHQLDPERVEVFLHALTSREASIQLIAITNTDGNRISQVHTQRGEKPLFRNLLSKNFKEKDWFRAVMETHEPFYSDLYFSRYTQELTLTAALPITNPAGELCAVMDIDFKFNELVKLVTPIPDEILDLKEY
ncbi:MAG TPA: histone-lysine N-methyltransferase [Armatimonadota bacterium]